MNNIVEWLSQLANTTHFKQNTEKLFLENEIKKIDIGSRSNKQTCNHTFVVDVKNMSVA